MTRLLLLFCFIASSAISNGQIKALTENGKQVLLFDNGTWKYADSSSFTPRALNALTTNSEPFVKSPAATFLVKSNTFNVGVNIDPENWTFETRKPNERNPEYRFSPKNAEGYAMMITERMSIPLETLRTIALSNAQKAAADAKETSAEYRTVNKKRVLCLQFSGTIQGMKFKYLGYYYSNNKGTIQLLTFTTEQFFDDLQKDFETFLNGLVELDEK